MRRANGVIVRSQKVGKRGRSTWRVFVNVVVIVKFCTNDRFDACVAIALIGEVLACLR